jgi:hypothetical protein
MSTDRLLLALLIFLGCLALISLRLLSRRHLGAAKILSHLGNVVILVLLAVLLLNPQAHPGWIALILLLVGGILTSAASGALHLAKSNDLKEIELQDMRRWYDGLNHVQLMWFGYFEPVGWGAMKSFVRAARDPAQRARYRWEITVGLTGLLMILGGIVCALLPLVLKIRSATGP